MTHNGSSGRFGGFGNQGGAGGAGFVLPFAPLRSHNADPDLARIVEEARSVHGDPVASKTLPAAVDFRLGESDVLSVSDGVAERILKHRASLGMNDSTSGTVGNSDEAFAALDPSALARLPAPESLLGPAAADALDATSVPEPGSLLLVGTGLLLATRSLRRRSS